MERDLLLQNRPWQARRNYTLFVNFIINRHEAFLFAQVIDASVTLGGGGGNNEDCSPRWIT